jgi:CBS domain-containing protein
MPQNIRDVMTSNPCTIDADKSVAYAAKMMRDEDVGLAPIVEGDKLIGMLTDRDIAVRVAAQGKDPEQVKVRDVASRKLVTIDPQQDLDEALRIMAKHQVRRLPVVEEDGRLVGVVAQADIAREGDDTKTGRLVEEISESGGQMSSFEEGQGERQVERQVEGQYEGLPVVEQDEQREEETISKVQAAARPRRRATRKRATTARKKKTTTARKKRSTGARKKKTTARKRAAGTRARSTARRSTAGRKRKTATRKKTTTARKRSTTARKRKTATRKKTTTARKRSTTARKRKTATRKKTTTARKRKTATRKRAPARRSTARKTTGARKRTTARRSTAKRTTARRSTARRRTTRRKS